MKAQLDSTNCLLNSTGYCCEFRYSCGHFLWNRSNGVLFRAIWSESSNVLQWSYSCKFILGHSQGGGNVVQNILQALGTSLCYGFHLGYCWQSIQLAPPTGYTLIITSFTLERQNHSDCFGTIQVPSVNKFIFLFHLRMEWQTLLSENILQCSAHTVPDNDLIILI